MLILERPWTRQPQMAVPISGANRANVLAYWGGANAGGGYILDVSRGYHAPASRMVPSQRGLVWNGARTYYTTTTRTLPAVAAGTPYLLSIWVQADNSDTSTDAFVKVGAWQGGAVPYAAACTIYGNNTTAGGLYIGHYGCDIRSSAGGHITAGAWVHISTIYGGGVIQTGLTVDPTAWTVRINDAAITMVAAGGAASGCPSTASLYANTATINDEDQHLYAGRAKIGSILLATGSVTRLRELSRQHYANEWALLEPQQIYIPTATAAGYTHPTLSLATAIDVTATSFKPRVTYTFA